MFVSRKCPGLTPLLLAAGQGNADAIKLLLDAKANIEATDTLGFSALHMAAEQG